MGVVTTYGQGYRNPVANVAPLAVFAEGHLHTIVSTIAVGAADSATSKYYIGRIPSSAVLDPASLAYGGGVVGLTSVSVGFDASPLPAGLIAWAASPALLVSAQDWHLAASFSLVQNVAVGNYGKRAWELLGLAQDPGGFIDVFATNVSGAGGAGTLQFFLKYLDDRN